MHSFVDYTQASRNSHHGNKDQLQKEMYFVICESCYWCASAQSPPHLRNETTPKCPGCGGNEINIIPIPRGHRQSVCWENLLLFICEAGPVHRTKPLEHHSTICSIKGIACSINLLYHYMILVAVMLIVNYRHLSTHRTFGICFPRIYWSNRSVLEPASYRLIATIFPMWVPVYVLHVTWSL